MSEWRDVTLDDVVELQRGHDLPATTRGSGSVPVIGSFGITGHHDVARYAGPGVAIGRSGASIGVATFCPSDYWPLNTCLFVKNFKGNDPRWIYYLLHWLDFSGFNSGSAQPSLNRNYLKGIEVALPALAEQRAIAGVLGALDDKIESNRRLADVAQSLCDTTFARHATAAAALGSVSDITMGSSPPGSTYNEEGVGLPFYQGVSDFGFRYPGRRIYCSEPVRAARAGDTLVSVRAPVGRLNRASEECCVGRGLAAVHSSAPTCLFYSLRASDDAWRPYNAEGTVFGAIKASDLAQIQVPWPDDVSPLESELSLSDSRLASALREAEQLATLRDALLPELLSGRLRVREAERVAEGVV